VSVECIHGLDEGLCDVCYPKKRPEPDVSAPRTRAPRRQPAGVKAPTRAPAKPVSFRDNKVVTLDVASQRIYHVTHIDNLEAIIAAGAIRADSQLDERPAVDVSSEETRSHRRTIEVLEHTHVADYVPFFLSPHSARWADLRDGAGGPHWSQDARAAVPGDFVLLVGSLAKAHVLTDGDASHLLTRFAATPDTFGRTLMRLLKDELALSSAEALVANKFDLDSVAVIGVSNMTMRKRVRALFEGSGFDPKVAVYPPWFAPLPAEEE
jgi:hypothetical protein